MVGSTAKLWLLATVLAMQGIKSSGCTFDCHSSSYCGSKPTLKADIDDQMELDLSGRSITSIVQNGLNCTNYHGATVLNFRDNAFTVLPPLHVVVPHSPAQDLRIMFDQNLITALPIGYLNDTDVFRPNCSATLSLTFNRITSLDSGVFATNVAIQTLYVNMNDNQVTALPQFLFHGFQGTQLEVYLNHNKISKMDAEVLFKVAVHDVFNPTTTLSLDYNPVGPTLDLTFLVRAEPGRWNFSFIGCSITNLTSVASTFTNTFTGTSLTIVFDNNTITSLEPLFQLFTIEMLGATPPSLSVSLNKNGLSGVWGATYDQDIIVSAESIYVYLNDNAITAISPRLFSYSFSTDVFVYFANNKITTLSASLFDTQYPGTSMHLYLENNSITFLPEGIFSEFSGASLYVGLAGNNIIRVDRNLAPPNNNIVLDLANNPVQCEAYVPQNNCVCTLALHKVYSLCGYAICHSDALGDFCKSGAFVPSSCDNATYPPLCESTCVNTSEYLQVVVDGDGNGGDNNVTHPRLTTRSSTLSTTATSITTSSSSSGNPLQAKCVTTTTCGRTNSSYATFALVAPTTTTDRTCSPCKTCPVGYRTSTCTPTHDSECYLSSGDVVLIVFSVLLAIAMSIATCRWGMVHKFEKESTRKDLEMTTQLLEVEATKTKVTEQSWKISWQSLVLGKTLGRGAFGTVSRALWFGSVVAVKVLSVDDVLDTESESFQAEASVMQSLHHPNLVTFFGFGTTNDGKPFLVTELMRETLRERLRAMHNSALNIGEGEANASVVDWSVARKWCADVAAGMLFLHSRDPLMVHRDLKSDNCLLGENDNLKIADFGTVLRPTSNKASALSNQTKTHLTTTTTTATDNTTITDHSQDNTRKQHFFDFVMTASIGAGTPLWMAPEVMVGKHGWSRYSPSVDVYSFGMVMFEIATLQLPFVQCASMDLFQFNDYVISGGRPDITTYNIPKTYVDLMLQCWSENPESRPNFSQVSTAVSRMIF